jgi:hypothetical protein
MFDRKTTQERDGSVDRLQFVRYRFHDLADLDHAQAGALRDEVGQRCGLDRAAIELGPSAAETFEELGDERARRILRRRAVREQARDDLVWLPVEKYAGEIEDDVHVVCAYVMGTTAPRASAAQPCHQAGSGRVQAAHIA